MIFEEKKKSLESTTKSPQTFEFKRKLKILMSRYGTGEKTSDTKLLIKLHSAAIIIQQCWRKKLQRLGFYLNQDSQSDLYIDSEMDAMNTEKRKPQHQRQQNQRGTSPLRVKNLNKHNYLQAAEENKKDSTKFYGEDSSDLEKVVMCSVISSGRPEGEESLSNTQKYVPLRQKQQKQQSLPQPKIKNSVNSQTFKYQERLNVRSNDNSSGGDSIIISSQRKSVVPSLDLGKLQISRGKSEYPNEREIA